MKLSYVLDGTGWATASIEHEGLHCDMTVSYLSDSLSEMAQAAICLLEGSKLVKFSFDDEPGEHRCVVNLASNEKVEICVFWFKELWSNLPDAQGSQVFVCSCSMARFCGEVLSCMQRLLDEHGVDGYKKLWVGHDFPMEKFEKLKNLQRARKT